LAWAFGCLLQVCKFLLAWQRSRSCGKAFPRFPAKRAQIFYNISLNTNGEVEPGCVTGAIIIPLCNINAAYHGVSRVCYYDFVVQAPAKIEVFAPHKRFKKTKVDPCTSEFINK